MKVLTERNGTNICEAPNPYLLEEGKTLVLTPPLRSVCSSSGGGDGCSSRYYYDENQHCERE